MRRMTLAEQQHDARMRGVESTHQHRDRPVEWLTGAIVEVAEAVASETQHRHYRLGLLSGYIAILSSREDAEARAALVATVSNPATFAQLSDAMRDAGGE